MPSQDISNFELFLCVLCASAVNSAFPTFGCGYAALSLCGEENLDITLGRGRRAELRAAR